MGELKKEFNPGQVVTGGSTGTGQMTSNIDHSGNPYSFNPEFQVQTRPTFLSAFLQNLGPALAGGAGADSFGGGLAGGLHGVEENKRYQSNQKQQAQQTAFTQQRETRLANAQEALAKLQAAQATKALQQPTDTNLNEFDVWRQQNPGAPVADFLKLKASLTPQSIAQPNELQQWLNENPGKTTTDYLRFKSSLTGVSDSGGTEEKAYRQALESNPKLSRTDFHKQWGELGREELTASTRTMVEAAPKVNNFVSKVTKMIDDMDAGLGPTASRWKEFKAGRVGLSDPAFTKLRTDVGLLTTLLMRMHVGARGGEYIMKHFTELIDSSKQSPENLKAALEEIGSYANDVIEEGKTGGRMGLGNQTGAGIPIPSGASIGAPN